VPAKAYLPAQGWGRGGPGFYEDLLGSGVISLREGLDEGCLNGLLESQLDFSAEDDWRELKIGREDGGSQLTPAEPTACAMRDWG